MNKLYNNQTNITSEFKSLLLKIYPNIRKTILNFLPSILFGIIKAESIASSDIANSLSDEKKWAKLDSKKNEFIDFGIINILTLIYYGIKLFLILLILMLSNIRIIKYILLLIICFLILIILFL